MNSKVYKYCVVPMCRNTSAKTPNKLFVYMPQADDIRKQWFLLARRHDPPKSKNAYFCEDHFDMPNDMENYMEYHIMGTVGHIRMRPNCMPSKFFCQAGRYNKSFPASRPTTVKRQRKRLVEDIMKQSIIDKNKYNSQESEDSGKIGAPLRSSALRKGNPTNTVKRAQVHSIRFPTDDSRLELWLKNIQKPSWRPRKYDYICSLHFSDDCFIRHNSCTTLKKCSKPTILSCSVENISSTHENMVLPRPSVSGTRMVTPAPSVPETIVVEVGRRLINEQDHTNLSFRTTSCDPQQSTASKKVRSLPEVCDNIRHDHRYENTSWSSNKALQRVGKSRARVKVMLQHVKRLKQPTSTVGTQSTSAASGGNQDQSNIAQGLKKHAPSQAKKRKADPSPDSSDTSDASLTGLDQPDLELPGPGQPGPSASAVLHQTLCSCCLSVVGAVTLGGSGYADTLKDCFDIVYPAELSSTATICWDCVAKLNAAVQFKRRALECQSTLASCLGTGVIPFVSDLGPADTLTIARKEDGTLVIKEEAVDIDEVPLVPPERPIITDLLKVHARILEEYDLSPDDELLACTDTEPVNANEHIESPLFTESSPLNEDTLMAKNLERQTTDDDKLLQNVCQCSEKCYMKFCRLEIPQFRRECEKYHANSCNINHTDIFLTGAMACIVERSQPYSEVTYKFRGLTVCQEFFMYVFVLSKERCNDMVHKMQDKAVYKLTNKSLGVQLFAIEFLKLYSMQSSLILPGRFSNEYPDLHILPRGATKMAIYSQYAKACVATKTKCINKIIWTKIWDQFCPYIVHKMPSDLCYTCREHAQRLRRACSTRSGLDINELQRCLSHLQLVKDEIAFYERSMLRPAAGDGTFHCAFDYPQLLRLPYDAAPVSLSMDDTHGVALFAVACQPPGETVVYVVPECVGGDSVNTVLSLLHHYLESAAGPGGAAQLHCGPLLRAARVLQYAAWRAARAPRCRLAFPPPGHDTRPSCLGLLKPALRTRPARCMQDLCDVLESIGVTTVPVATDSGVLNVPMYKWDAFFDARNPVPFPNIQKYCHFEADSSNIGVIKCKVSERSDTSDDVLVLNSGRLAGLPELLKPAGLSTARRQNLDEEVERHLDEAEVLIEFPHIEVQDPLQLIKDEIKMEIEEHNVY